MRLTLFQQAILEAISTRKLKSARTRTREGNTIKKLITMGVVGFQIKHHERGETSYHGKHIPNFTTYIGLFVKDPRHTAIRRSR